MQRFPTVCDTLHFPARPWGAEQVQCAIFLLIRLVAPCCCVCACECVSVHNTCLWGCTLFDCVSACIHVHNICMTQEGVVSNAMPKPFPANTGVLAETTPDFLSLRMGDWIPGAGWLHPPEVYWQDSFTGAGTWKPTPTFSHPSVRCSLRMEA